MMKLPNVPKSICYVADVTFKVSHLYFFFFVYNINCVYDTNPGTVASGSTLKVLRLIIFYNLNFHL